MKWIFLAGLLALIPLLTGLLRAQPKYLLHACFALGLLLFFMDPNLSVSPINWKWPGPVKGVEISILDAIAIAMILATRPTRTPLGLKIGFGIYVTALVISTFAARQVMPSLFYAWQLLRAVVVFVAVARASAAAEGAPFALAAGLGSAIMIEALMTTEQFLSGNPQPGGNLGHRNFLGLTSHFAVMPAFALLLMGRRSYLASLVVLSGLLIAVEGGSRATIGLMGSGLVVTAVLSMRHRFTGRKAAFAVAAVVALALAIPATIWAVQRRSEVALESSDHERKAFTDAAKMVIADYPLGVGANQYVIVVNLGGYSDRAGAAWNPQNRAAPVHNSYLLVTAEMGFLGLIGFLTVLLAGIATGLTAMRQADQSERSELMVGFVGALIIVCAHFAYEWLFMTAHVHYLLAMNMGAMAGVAAALQQSARRKRSGAAAPAPRPAS